MSVLYHLEQIKKEGKSNVSHVVCYEKQKNWGGQWNYSWRSGTDEYGELVHSSMYKTLWINGPKEEIEYPDYTCLEHFGKNIPSFVPRAVYFDYLEGRWRKNDLRKYVHFSSVVRFVNYDEDSDEFTVVAEDLAEQRQIPAEKFDYVIVATGHFSVPHFPFYPGVDDFPGRKLHAHDLRDPAEFKGQTVLIIGSSLTAEDVAVQLYKYGARKIIATYLHRPMGLKWPEEIEERPILRKVQAKTVFFSDDSTATVDAIIFCTGYQHHYPFLDESLKLRTKNSYSVANLYKGILFTEGGNDRLMYIGAQNLVYSLPMFEVQAFWSVKYINGDIQVPDRETMRADWKNWLEKNKEVKHLGDAINFQSDYVVGLAQEAGFKHDICIKQILHDWKQARETDILNYRDTCFTSKFTNVTAPPPSKKFMANMDDSFESFMNSVP